MPVSILPFFGTLVASISGIHVTNLNISGFRCIICLHVRSHMVRW